MVITHPGTGIVTLFSKIEEQCATPRRLASIHGRANNAAFTRIFAACGAAHTPLLCSLSVVSTRKNAWRPVVVFGTALLLPSLNDPFFNEDEASQLFLSSPNTPPQTP